MLRTIVCGCALLVAAPVRGEPPGLTYLTRVPRTAPQYCGVDSLYVCLKAAHRDIRLHDLEARLKPGARGVTLDELAIAAADVGVQTTAVEIGTEKLASLDGPAVLHVRENHYVAYLGRRGDRLVLFDNEVGLIEATWEGFDQRYRYQGWALVVNTGPAWAGSELPARWGLLGVGIGLVALSGYRAIRRRAAQPGRGAT